jgi:hypothetical protein
MAMAATKKDARSGAKRPRALCAMRLRREGKAGPEPTAVAMRAGKKGWPPQLDAAVAGVGFTIGAHAPPGGTRRQRIVRLVSDLRQMCQALSGLIPVVSLSTISPVGRIR